MNRTYSPAEILEAMKFLGVLQQNDIALGLPTPPINREAAIDYLRHMDYEDSIEHCPVCSGTAHNCLNGR